ncbi:MAG: hypothetical protein JO304_04875 [Solirubrobacterales bacterium]|nr:hypothetical protein [Solirubrobacterales bacterium]
MTVFSLLWPGGEHIQRLVYAFGRLNGPARVDELAVIHFARLAVIDRFPDHGQPPDDLRQRLQLFESNYNGSFGQYIDTFVDEVPGKMRAFWGTSYGFPWCLPLGPFKRYIEANEFRIDHYYVRNPRATVKMVSSALRIVAANAQLLRKARGLEPGTFADRLRKLVTDLQSDL